MSCKGMSVTAARQLIDQTCAKFNVPLFILRDFDIAGFSIAKTLHQSNDRYEFKTRSGKDFKVVDLGLRLADVERLRLASERVVITKGKKGGYSALRARLKINGATPAEIEFLLSGRRVELNAMTSRQFVNLLESKLTAHGVRKVIPDATGLADAYRLFSRAAKTKAAVEEALAAMTKQEIVVPTNLERRLRAHLKVNPASSWDDAIEALASEDDRS